MLSSILLVLASALPPITSSVEAIAQLRGPQRVDALANVKDACRGKHRRDLRDRPELYKQIAELYASGTLELKRAALDTSPCFSAKTFAPLLATALADRDDAAVAYGAEVAARLEDPALLAELHAAGAARKTACLGPDLSDKAADACVWLTYAPGALLGAADEAARKTAAERAVEMFAAEHPKIREVAVETLAASRLPAFAPRLAELIAREKKSGGFAKPNSRELLRRFEDREKTLKRGIAPRE